MLVFINLLHSSKFGCHRSKLWLAVAVRCVSFADAASFVAAVCFLAQARLLFRESDEVLGAQTFLATPMLFF